VGRKVGVESGVLVAGGTIAVCVIKKAADNVPMLCVSSAFISGVGEAGGCPPQETSSTVARSIRMIDFPACFIFTSMLRYWIFPACVDI
jgi:hypothetical protein